MRRNNIWWWEDYGYPAIGLVVVLSVIGLIGYGIYWRYQHPCIQYEAVWVEAWTEIQTHYMSCGKDCQTSYVIPVFHPAHYEQRCAIYGNRAEGDREGQPARIFRIPNERVEK